jgi:hypothetical protein
MKKLMKKSTLLLAFALVFAGKNQPVYAVEQSNSEENFDSLEISESSKLEKSRTALKESIDQATGLLNTMDREVNYVNIGAKSYSSMKKMLEPIAQLYNMTLDLYQNIIKSGIGSENDLEEVKTIPSEIKNIVINAINNTTTQEDLDERNIITNNFTTTNDLLDFFKSIDKLIDKHWNRDSVWSAEYNDEYVPGRSKNYANEQAVGHREAMAEYAVLLRNIAKEVYVEVEPESHFRNALNRVSELVNQLLLQSESNNNNAKPNQKNETIAQQMNRLNNVIVAYTNGIAKIENETTIRYGGLIELAKKIDTMDDKLSDFGLSVRRMISKYEKLDKKHGKELNEKYGNDISAVRRFYNDLQKEAQHIYDRFAENHKEALFFKPTLEAKQASHTLKMEELFNEMKDMDANLRKAHDDISHQDGVKSTDEEAKMASYKEKENALYEIAKELIKSAYPLIKPGSKIQKALKNLEELANK